MILLDTHVVVWLALEPSRISKKARSTIEVTRQRADGLAVSDITLLEIAAIENKGRIKLNVSLEAFLAEVESRFIVMPMTGRIRRCSGTTGDLSEGPGRSSYRRDGACRRNSSDYCR